MDRIQQQALAITDERIVLEHGLLRLFVRSPAMFLRATLRSEAGLDVMASPLLRLRDEYSAVLALDGIEPPAQLSVVLHTADGSEIIFGRKMTEHLKKLESLTDKPAAAAGRKAIVRGVVPGSAAPRHVSIYADGATAGLDVRISSADETDASLLPANKPVATKPNPICFSIVTPMYNVDGYLDEFMASIVGQTVGFRSQIELIVVDDGSTDRSAKVIKRWQRKYPENIHFHHAPNAGPSAARNLGLQHANHLGSHLLIPMISSSSTISSAYQRPFGMNQISLWSPATLSILSKRSRPAETPFARYRFANGQPAGLRFRARPRHSNRVSAAIFVKKVIDDNHLRFDERIRPNFEDGHFAARYALRIPDKLVAFLTDARYLYRHRADTHRCTDRAVVP